MSDEILERLRAVAIVVMLVCIAHAAGCKSAPIAPYNDTVAQIDQMIADLKAAPIDPGTVAIRKRQITTLVKAREQVVRLSAENASEAGWSGAAKGAAAAGGVMLVIVGAVVWLRRK